MSIDIPRVAHASPVRTGTRPLDWPAPLVRANCVAACAEISALLMAPPVLLGPSPVHINLALSQGLHYLFINTQDDQLSMTLIQGASLPSN